MSIESVQPKLFEPTSATVDQRTVLLYALGEFQSRGHKLAGRELALDRLHRAFVRSAERFGVPELSDIETVKGLRDLGVNVEEIPDFFAKRPYRITVPEKICEAALQIAAKTI